MMNRYISIPKNEIGIAEYDTGIDESENLVMMELPEKEFLQLIPAFSMFNDMFGIMIDDCESEIIKSENLQECYKLINRFGLDVPVFLSAIKEGMKYGTMVALDF